MIQKRSAPRPPPGTVYKVGGTPHCVTRVLRASRGCRPSLAMFAKLELEFEHILAMIAGARVQALASNDCVQGLSSNNGNNS